MRTKELKSYFASPIAYIVIGCFAALYGFFFIAILRYFVGARHAGRHDRRAQSMNVNQQLIRPLLQNVTVVVLFLLPMVTMRTYSEEKRSGTIELLLTSPLTDFQIVMGKFLGAHGALRGDARRHAHSLRRPVPLRQPRSGSRF